MEPSRKVHWDGIYNARPLDEVSWHQAHPERSLALIAATGLGHEARILDVGGGASRLVDCLLDAGYQQLTVLDVSAIALDHARTRLGPRAHLVEWLEADATAFDLGHAVDIWHDRAVFHFLTEPADRAAYLARLDRHLSPQGQIIIATFALDGPERCSNLPVVRYSAETLAQTMGAGFQLVDSQTEQHLTPRGASQSFLYHRFRRN